MQLNGSYKDPGNDTHTIKWLLGDGNTSSSLNPTHQYLVKPGKYTAKLTVTDDDSGTGSDNATIKVRREDSVLSRPNASVIYGEAAKVNVTMLDDDEHALLHQADKPKEVYLEYLNTTWVNLAKDNLTSPNNTDHKLEFSFKVNVSPGNYSLRVRFDGDTYYNGTTSQGALRVQLQQYPGQLSPPTDPDSDGLYEDLNGNGRMDFNDVVVLFNNLGWTEENQPIGCFDFNQNGRIDFDDVVQLFKEL